MTHLLILTLAACAFGDVTPQAPPVRPPQAPRVAQAPPVKQSVRVAAVMHDHACPICQSTCSCGCQQGGACNCTKTPPATAAREKKFEATVVSLKSEGGAVRAEFRLAGDAGDDPPLSVLLPYRLTLDGKPSTAGEMAGMALPSATVTVMGTSVVAVDFHRARQAMVTAPPPISYYAAPSFGGGGFGGGGACRT